MQKILRFTQHRVDISPYVLLLGLIFITDVLPAKSLNTLCNESFEIVSEDAICLHNATTNSNGQFKQKLKIKGVQGKTWYIENSVNFYSSFSSSPPSTPTPFLYGPSGDLLTEEIVSGTQSEYYLYGIFEEGREYSVILKSTTGDFLCINGGGSTYSNLNVSGPTSVCTLSSRSYNVVPSQPGYAVHVSGGIILSASSDSSEINVQWGASTGVFSIVFKNKDALICQNPGILKIAVGNSTNTLSCRSQVQISIDGDCEAEVTPSMISSQSITPNTPIVVHLRNMDNTLIPGNYVTSAYIGKTLIAQLVEGCGGNSCWGKIKIEDKMPPRILCVDTIEVNCFNIDAHVEPKAIDNCGASVNVELIDSVYKGLQCNEDYTSFIVKKYRAEDYWGNKSQVCTQVLAVKRLDLEDVDFPANYTMANALSCNTYLMDEHGNPHVDVTGVPSIYGHKLFNGYIAACNVWAFYNDTEVGFLGCTKKIIRKWTIVEWWCESSTIRQEDQYLLISDNEAPKFTCANAIITSAQYGKCEALVTFNPVENLTDNCSNKFEVDISCPGGFIDNSNGGGLVTLPMGVHEITYTVYDECGNHSECTTTVTVVDKFPPTVSCHGNIVISLTSDGMAYLYPESIDDGTYDACGLDTFRVRRIDGDTICNPNKNFAKSILFCCKDAGNEVMVEMKAWDRAGNSNSCMVNVTIQDKIPPKIFCPSDVTISCEVEYEINNLNQYGVPTIEDACEVTLVEESTAFVNQCRVGYIERVFTARDRNGMSQCTSYVYITKEENSVIITWPLDYSVTGGCTNGDLSPENLPDLYSRPKFNDGICDLFASNMEDKFFEFDDGNGSCFKILRTWTVIDYCRMNESGYHPYVHQQTIKVSNNVDPTISIEADDEACTNINECDFGQISLRAIGHDDCTPEENLEWQYSIDFDYSGTFSADFTRKGNGHVIDASGEYSVGKHNIRFSFEDKCGNTITKSHDFVIKNCKSPTAVCLSGISIVLGEMTIDNQPIRMACIEASSINASSSHVCGYPIEFSFSRDIKDKSKCFTCEDIGNKDISLYVTDIYGNQSFCNTNIAIQNHTGTDVSITGPNEICSGIPSTLSIVTNSNGSILWSTGAMTTNITIAPTMTTTYSVTITSSDGCNLVASKTVIVNPLNTQISGNNVICVNDSVTLEANGLGSFLWNTGANTSSIKVAPSLTTTYSVTVTSQLGCTTSGSKSVTVNPLPGGFIATATSPVCAGANCALSVSNLPQGSTVLWSTGSNNPNTVANPIQNTTFSVTVTSDQGCISIQSLNVIVNPNPVATISGDNMICTGESTTLTATGGPLYFWNFDNIQTPSITVSPTSNSVYTVTVVNSFGCRDVESIMILVSPRPTLILFGDTDICLGDSTILTADAGGSGITYVWSDAGQTTQSITVSPMQNTTYVVTVTNAGGCTSSLGISVVVKLCNGITTSILKGSILTENGEPVRDFVMNLIGSNFQDIKTNSDGHYLFPEMQSEEDYMLEPIRNDNLLNGVSVLDLVLIQRHILGIKKITSPYKLIAADVNNDKKISTADLILLRKAILGNVNAFSNNTSWKAIDKSYQFPLRENPFSENYPMSHELLPLAGIENVDFVGVKIGDVNDSYTELNSKLQRQNRIEIITNDRVLTPGESISIELKIGNIVPLDGGQLEIAIKDMEVLSITSDLLSKHQFEYKINNNKLFIIFDVEKEIIADDKVLFNIKVIPSQQGKLSNNFLFSNDSFKTEVYTKLEPVKTILQFTEIKQPVCENWQVKVRPNPWYENTSIDFTYPIASTFDFKVYNMQKIIVYQSIVSSNIGSNTIEISSKEISNQGLYIFELTNGIDVIQGKMLRLY